MECIPQGSLAELTSNAKKMGEFQRTHNLLVDDIGILLEVYGQSGDAQKPALARAIYKEFFSMVEADIYLINQFNPYQGFDDMHKIVQKFKKTYKYHSVTFKKANIHEKYKSIEFLHFLRAIGKRNDFTHPKGRISLTIGPDDIKAIERIFEAYRLHVNALMTDVGLSVESPLHLPL
jgi:hypothetical protein